MASSLPKLASSAIASQASFRHFLHSFSPSFSTKQEPSTGGRNDSFLSNASNLSLADLDSNFSSYNSILRSFQSELADAGSALVDDADLTDLISISPEPQLVPDREDFGGLFDSLPSEFVVNPSLSSDSLIRMSLSQELLNTPLSIPDFAAPVAPAAVASSAPATVATPPASVATPAESVPMDTAADSSRVSWAIGESSLDGTTDASFSNADKTPPLSPGWSQLDNPLPVLNDMDLEALWSLGATSPTPSACQTSTHSSTPRASSPAAKRSKKLTRSASSSVVSSVASSAPTMPPPNAPPAVVARAAKRKNTERLKELDARQAQLKTNIQATQTVVNETLQMLALLWKDKKI